MSAFGGTSKRARFTEEQIIGILQEREAEAKTADLARKYGVLANDALQLEGQVRRHGGLARPSG